MIKHWTLGHTAVASSIIGGCLLLASNNMRGKCECAPLNNFAATVHPVGQPGTGVTLGANGLPLDGRAGLAGSKAPAKSLAAVQPGARGLLGKGQPAANKLADAGISNGVGRHSWKLGAEGAGDAISAVGPKPQASTDFGPNGGAGPMGGGDGSSGKSIGNSLSGGGGGGAGGGSAGGAGMPAGNGTGSGSGTGTGGANTNHSGDTTSSVPVSGGSAPGTGGSGSGSGGAGSGTGGSGSSSGSSSGGSGPGDQGHHQQGGTGAGGDGHGHKDDGFGPPPGMPGGHKPGETGHGHGGDGFGPHPGTADGSHSDGDHDGGNKGGHGGSHEGTSKDHSGAHNANGGSHSGGKGDSGHDRDGDHDFNLHNLLGTDDHKPGTGDHGGDHGRGDAGQGAAVEVPEPGMLGLMGLGVAGLAWARRRRKTGSSVQISDAADANHEADQAGSVDASDDAA